MAAFLGWLITRPVKYTSLERVSSENNSFSIKIPAISKQYLRTAEIIDYQHVAVSGDLLSRVRIDKQTLNDSQAEQMAVRLKSPDGLKNELIKQTFSDPQISRLAVTNYDLKLNKLVSQAYGYSYYYKDREFQGYLVVALRQNSLYIIRTEAVTDVWGQNQKVWAEILQSFEGS